MEKPIFRTVKGLMDHRDRDKKIITLLEKANQFVLFGTATFPDKGVSTFDKLEKDRMNLFKEIKELIGELENNDDS